MYLSLEGIFQTKQRPILQSLEYWFLASIN
jgi:hypothetical protein